MIDLKELSIEDLRALRAKVNAVIRRKKRAARVLPPKYANPTNRRETWAGRGLRPRWAQNMSERKLEACRV